MASITITQMRERLYSAVVCDALDKLGLPNQSPLVALRPLTVAGVCRQMSNHGRKGRKRCQSQPLHQRPREMPECTMTLRSSRYGPVRSRRRLRA